MTNKELIKHVAVKLDEEYRALIAEGTTQQAKEADLVVCVLQKLKSFIDSLPEESGCEANFITKNEDLEEEIDRYYSDWQFDDDTIYEDMRDICRHFAEWQKLKDMGIANESKDAVTNILNSSDSPLDAYATEVAFTMLPANLTENYHMTSRSRISDAVRLGAEWQRKKDQETIELAEDHAMLAGMMKERKEMMKEAVETTIVNDWQYGKDPDHAIIPAIHQRIEGFDIGDRVKIIIVKEEQQ